MTELWRIAITFAGLGAIGAFVFWSLYRDWLRLPIFPKLTKDQSFKLMLVFLVLVFLSLIAMMVTYVQIHNQQVQASGLMREIKAYRHSLMGLLLRERRRSDQLASDLAVASAETARLRSRIQELASRIKDLIEKLAAQVSLDSLPSDEQFELRLARAATASAESDFERALELLPEEGSVRLVRHALDVATIRGYALEGQGKFDEALLSYRRVLSFHPERTEIRFQVVNCLASLNRTNAASNELARLVASYSDRSEEDDDSGAELALAQEKLENLQEPVERNSGDGVAESDSRGEVSVATQRPPLSGPDEREPGHRQKNLVATSNGGALVDPPAEYSDSWAARHLIDSSPDTYYAAPHAAPVSLVLGFQDRRAATISRIEVLPFTSDDSSNWAREVEIEFAEKHPFTGFRSAQRMNVSPNRDSNVLKIAPPRRARFVRFNLLSNGGGSWMELNEIRVFGDFVEDRTTVPALKNLALQNNGARIVAVTSEYGGSYEATRLINGSSDGYWCSKNSEIQDVVIELERRSSVRFVCINPYAGNTTSDWARRAKVLLSNESPTTGFMDVGELKIEPIGRDSVLELSEPMQAKFVKIIFLENGGGSYVSAGEIKVYGSSIDGN